MHYRSCVLALITACTTLSFIGEPALADGGPLNHAAVATRTIVDEPNRIKVELEAVERDRAELRVFSRGRQVATHSIDLFLPNLEELSMQYTDINGDGARDILVVTQVNGMSQEFHDAFLWDSRRQSFTPDLEISGTGSIEQLYGRRGCIEIIQLCNGRRHASTQTYCWVSENNRWALIDESSSCY